MPHRPRIQLDQVPLHIVQRGHNCRCFGDEGEFEAVKYSTMTPLIRCGGRLKLIAAIEEAAVIQRILTHLGLAAQPPPRAPAVRVDLFEATIRTGFLTGLGVAFGQRACNRSNGVELRRAGRGNYLRS